MDKVVCTGTGTCDRNPRYAYTQSTTTVNSLNPSSPQTVVTSSGTYLIVPNLGSNSPLPAAILQISK